MGLYGKHIKLQGIRKDSSFYKGIFLLCLLALCFRPDSGYAQVITNTGAHITLTSGVFVDSRDVENTSGVVTNNGRFDLDGSYTNAGTTSGNGEYNLAGNWTNTDTFNEGTSTVTFEGTLNQSIETSGETFHNLVVTNTGETPDNRINLLDDAKVNGLFTFASGNVNSNSNKLYLTNPAIAALNYSSVSDSRVIGKFERGVNTAGTYLFPVGSYDYYNPLTLTPGTIDSPGSVLSEFIAQEPGNDGLPIPDVLVEVWETFPDGYWGLTANNGFSASDFDLTADGNGFEEIINLYNRLIKRPAMGLWTTDGDHRNATGTVAARDNLTNNISPAGSQFAIAKIRPRIMEQPEDTAICEEADGGFRVVATGYGSLEYIWQLLDENTGEWNAITDLPPYLGSLNATLLLNGVPITFNNNRYRVVITDIYNNFKESDSAKLTVDPIPDITNNILGDTICNNTGINIPLFSDVLGTSYEWDIFPDAHITGGFPDSQLSIKQSLANSDDSIQNIVYRVFPTGPGKTQCKGSSVDFKILVTPTLLVSASPFEYIGGKNIRCFGESNGSIDITPKGGFYLDEYSYFWKKNGLAYGEITTEDRNNLTEGLYEFEVADIIGCNYSSTIIISQPDTFKVETDSVIFVSCAGNLDGEIYLAPSGGTQPYRFSWVAYEDVIPFYGDDLIGTRYGLHEITVRDTNGCFFYTEENVESLNPMGIGFNPFPYGNYHVSCFGESNGSVQTTAIGNGYFSENYNYTWFDRDDNEISYLQNPTELSAGTYRVEIVDSLGCEGEKELILKQPDPISITKTNGKKPGNYDISCNDRSDGSVELEITGGHTGYLPSFHSWSMTGNPAFDNTTKNISGLRAGTYIIDVTDSYGCQNDAFFTLTQPSKIELDTALISDFNGYQVSCINFANSFIQPEISGGHGDYSYLWSTADGALSDPLSGNQSGLPAGNYHLELLDNINCPAEWDFVISEPDSIAVIYTPILHNGFEVSCFSGSDGIINLETSGGVSDYVYTWTSTDGSGITDGAESQTGLSRGLYSVSITDQNNCVAAWDFTLNEPEKLISGIDTTTISCFSNSDGSADITVTGGILPYSYLWSNGQTTEDIDSLAIGEYSVEVRDANNCVLNDIAIITEPAEILIDLSVPIQFNGRMISCYGASDASVNSVVSGGKINGLYQYNWSPVSSQSTSVSNVPAGLYHLEITDANGCKEVDSIQVVQPPMLITEVYETNPTCYGKSDGEITLIVQGGTPGTSGYSIEWADGQLGQTASTIGNGTYNVAIWDLNNCRIDTFGTLLQPELLHLSKEVAQPTCPDIPDGAIEYRIDGGTAPYDMRLNTLQVDELVTDLGDGVYHLVITDNNQCSLYDTTTLKGVSPMCIRVPNAITPNGDGVNDTWVIDQIEIYPSVKVEIYNRWGELIFYAGRGYSEPWDGTYKGRQLPIDSYYYVIDLNNGRDVVTGNITIIR